MEPPAHDSLSPQNMPDSMRDGYCAAKPFGAEVKKRLEAELVIELEEEGAVDFLKEFLADDTGESGDVDPMMEIDPNGEFRVNPTPIKLVHPRDQPTLKRKLMVRILLTVMARVVARLMRKTMVPAGMVVLEQEQVRVVAVVKRSLKNNPV